MSRRVILLAVLVSIFLVTPIISGFNTTPTSEYTTSSWPGGLVIDHTCIDLDAIPSQYIDAAQNAVKIHYAHTSHGGQITTGLARLKAANTTFDVSIASLSLPSDSGALCMYDGNSPHTYITPDLYWQGESARSITQAVIDDNPAFTVSLWSWCTQVDGIDTAGVQEYLDAMAMLESANPSITFVYMTGNAQATDESGYNRWVNNEMIRQYCIENDKILFDFADLDAWSNGVQHTYSYNPGDGTVQVPAEHPDFYGDEAGHTTYTSCEQKGSAFWWMVSMLAGWNNPTTTTSATTSTSTSATGTTSSTGTTSNGSILNLLDTTILFYVGVITIVLVIGYIAKRRVSG